MFLPANCAPHRDAVDGENLNQRGKMSNKERKKKGGKRTTSL
jgi:hypothetical protein